MRCPIKSLVWMPLAVAVALTSIGCQNEETDIATKEQTSVKSVSTEEPLFTVDVYDPKRDASKDLEMTVAKAMKSKKRVLIEVGGKW